MLPAPQREAKVDEEDAGVAAAGATAAGQGGGVEAARHGEVGGLDVVVDQALDG